MSRNWYAEEDQVPLRRFWMFKQRLKQSDRIDSGEDVGGRLPSERCEKCGKSTKYKKRMCVDHIQQQPYVVGLLAEINRYEDELSRLEIDPKFQVDDDSPVLNDFLTILENLNGVATFRRLAKYEEFSFKVVDRLAEYLVKQGLAVEDLTKRKHRRISLVGMVE